MLGTKRLIIEAQKLVWPREIKTTMIRPPFLLRDVQTKLCNCDSTPPEHLQ
jgi:hypothetical protein